MECNSIIRKGIKTIDLHAGRRYLIHLRFRKTARKTLPYSPLFTSILLYSPLFSFLALLRHRRAPTRSAPIHF
jgi:hypothetical protein